MWLGVCLGLTAVAVAAEGLDSRQSELEGVQARIGELRGELAGVAEEKQAEELELQRVETEIGKVTARIHEIERDREDGARRLDRLKADREAAGVELEIQRERLARTIRSSYAMGRRERLKLFLSQDDPARFSRVLTYYGYLQRRRAQRIEEMRALLNRISMTETEILREESRLELLLAEEGQASVRLQQAQAERKQVVAALDEDLVRRGAEVKRLEQDEARLKNLVARLKKLQERIQSAEEPTPPAVAGTDDAKSFRDRKGILRWPVPGKVRNAFGAPKGGGLAWDGALIGASAGDPVRAVHRGRVVFADWLKGYGLLVILDHGDGFMSLYGYNQSLLKATGDWVEAGEVISFVGNSGGRTEPGLYFGIRQGGKAVDPARWCGREAGDTLGKRSTESQRNDNAA